VSPEEKTEYSIVVKSLGEKIENLRQLQGTLDEVKVPYIDLTKKEGNVRPTNYLYIDVDECKTIEEVIEFAGPIVKEVAPKEKVILVSSIVGLVYDDFLEALNVHTTIITHNGETFASIVARSIEMEAVIQYLKGQERIVYTIYEDDEWLKVLPSDIFGRMLLAMREGDAIYLTRDRKCWDAIAWMRNLIANRSESVIVSSPTN
jgi:hypothetical protein